MKKKIFVVGLGQIGRAVMYYLSRISDSYQETTYELHGMDVSPMAMIEAQRLVPPHIDLNFHSPTDVDPAIFSVDEFDHMLGNINPDLVISAMPYHRNEFIASKVLARKIPYLDLGGSDSVRFQINKLACSNGAPAMTDLGLAPGLVNIIALNEALNHPPRDRYNTSVRMYVGGLPMRNDINPLKYTLNWSIDGLLNEYMSECFVLRGGEIMSVPGMSEHEVVSSNNLGTLEAFNTSGGAATLLTSIRDYGFQNCQYKTLRYFGHLEMVKFLINAGLDGTALHQVFTATKPISDLAIIMVKVFDGADEHSVEKIYFPQNGMTAMQATTAAPVAVVADLILAGEMHAPGRLLTYEDIPLDSFFARLDNLLL